MFNKFFSSLIILTALLVFDGWGQPWSYNFGTSTGNHTSGVSTTFLPTPPSGIARVRIGTTAGSFNLEDQTIAFGSGSYLRGVAPTSASVNKFSVYDYSAGKAAILSFRVRLGASDGTATASSGTWIMVLGDGATLSDNNALTSAHAFTGLQWVFGSSGAITTTYRNAGAWVALGSTPFSQGVDYLVEIYANNTTGTLNYTKSGAKSVAANKVDIWIDGVLVGDDLAKGAMANDVNIDSYMFYSISSTGNVANIFLDDFSYSNTITSSALTPPTLTADATDNNVDNNIDITFTDDATWRSAITAVKVGTTALTVTTDYVITAGNLQLKPSGLNSLLTTSGTKSITVEATGYNNATVSQAINAGAPTTNSTAAINLALALGTTRTVTATAKDQYNNLVSGYTFKYDATITNNNATTTESYTIDGTARTTTQNDLSVVAATNVSGVATFTIQVPSQIDQSDGLSVQVQLTNGSTNIGSSFSITGPDPTVVITGVDPTTNSFAVGSSNNILYRLKLDVTVNPATLNGAAFLIDGVFAASDISTGGYKLYYSADITFDPGTDQLLESISATNDNSELLGFTATKLFTVGTGYLFLTVDLDAGASVGNMISIFTPVITDFTFSTTVSKSGTFTAAEIHAFAGLPPTLSADETNNTVDNDIDITFIDDATWRGAITAVKINGTALEVADYTITAGSLKLKPSIGNSLLTTSGSKNISVDATNYGAATVVQAINAGAPTANSTASISAALALNTTRTVTATAKDQYNNLVSGYTFKYDATITDANTTTDESYNIDGTARTASVTDIGLVNATNASGVATFDITIPAVVDANDGISVQVQLENGTINVGTAFSFGNQPTVALTGADPGSGNFIRSSSQNVLYRYQVVVTSAAVTLNQLVATLAGTYQSIDLGIASLKIYFSTDATLDGGDEQIGTGRTSVSTGTGEDVTFTGLFKVFPTGTTYIFLTADINYDATVTRTISGSSDAIADLTFAETFTNGTHSFGAANIHNIVSIPGAPTDLLISEYVEGSSNTKYIEIYNGTGSPVDLSDYKLGLATNGNTTPTLYQMYTILPSGAVKVYRNSSAADLIGIDDSSSSAINYNGDDALALYKISTDSYVDIFGKIGEDPGSAWVVNGISTLDKTLRRKSNITQGVNTNPVSGFPTLGTEWDMFNIDVVSGLGSHSHSTFTSSYTQAVARGSNNYGFLNTGVQINFVGVTTEGTVTLSRYEGAATAVSGITEANVSGFRWVIDGGTTVFDAATSIRFKASSLTGIPDVTTAVIKLYKRETPGSGAFTLVGTLTYDASTDEFFVSGISSFSEFVMASESEPLPVELTSFTAKSSGSTVTLNWETKTEVDNNGFEVERNTNGNWQKIGFVEGHGTANSPKYYSFVDNGAIGNRVQYRLKQIDNDGTTEYSSIVEVELNPTNFALYQNYPNPFNPSTMIRFSMPVSGNVALNVFNTLGEKVATLLNGQMEAGYHEVSFDAKKLPSGLYFYEIKTGDFSSIKKMILMK